MILIVMEVGLLTKQVYAARLKVSLTAMVIRDTNAGATHHSKVRLKSNYEFVLNLVTNRRNLFSYPVQKMKVLEHFCR